MSVESFVGRARTRSVLSRSALFVGVLLLAAGVLGVGYAGHGVRSVSVRVAGVPVEMVRPADDAGLGRPAVVVAHGYAGSGRLMRPFADTLARRGYIVALPDLAGHAGNTRPLAGRDEIDRELAGVVRYVRGLPEVDAMRVALLGHSMGAAAVVRVGAADPMIAATVAISLGDDAAALRPGPRRLLSIVGALEPVGIQSVARAAGAGDGRRAVRVPLVEHVGVLYADRTHQEAARWLDEALDHRPERHVIAAKRRVAAGGLSMVGMLLLVTAALVRPSRRGSRSTAAWPVQRLGVPLLWLAGAVMVAPVSGLVGGWLLARALPAALCGYLVGYFAFTGAALGTVALMAHRRTGGRLPQVNVDSPALARTVALAVAVSVAVVVPIHLGLTSVVPHGPRWWLIVLLALATAVMLCAAHAVARPPWSIAVLMAVCLPLPAAAIVGLAPGFLALVTPLIAALLAMHLLVAGVAQLTGTPWWRTVPAGALLIAWPVATTLPLT